MYSLMCLCVTPFGEYFSVLISNFPILCYLIFFISLLISSFSIPKSFIFPLRIACDKSVRNLWNAGCLPTTFPGSCMEWVVKMMFCALPNSVPDIPLEKQLQLVSAELQRQTPVFKLQQFPFFFQAVLAGITSKQRPEIPGLVMQECGINFLFSIYF